MDANQPPTAGALPALLLAGDKLLQSMEADGLEILDHAHAVFRTIALVDMFYAIAGVLSAFKTKVLYAQGRFGTGSYLTSSAGLGHEGAVAIAARADILLSGIGHAKGAVHPAGCDDHHKGSIQAFDAGFNREK